MSQTTFDTTGENTQRVRSVGEILRDSRKGIFWTIIALLLIAALLGIYFFNQKDENPPPFDTASYSQDGTRALTQVLDKHGVTMHEADSIDAVETQLQETPDATVLIVDAQNILSSAPPQRVEQLARAVPAEQRVIFARYPHSELADEVDTDVGYSDAEVLHRGSQCRLDFTDDADEISHVTYRLIPSEDTSSECYTGADADGAVIVEDSDGVVMVSEPHLLTNQLIGDADNATVMLRLAGQSENVVLYTPSPADVMDAGSQQFALSFPPPVRFGIIWALIVTVIVLIWRGRRHGPVVREPLPVEVSSVETVVGQARLHQRGKHSGYTLQTLQKATLARLSTMMRLGTGVDDEQVIASAADRLNVPARQIAGLFDYHETVSPKELTATAQALKDLEERVRQAIYET